VADLQSATTEQKVCNPHNYKSNRTLHITNPQLNWVRLQIRSNDFRHHRTSAKSETEADLAKVVGSAKAKAILAFFATQQ